MVRGTRRGLSCVADGRPAATARRLHLRHAHAHEHVHAHAHAHVHVHVVHVHVWSVPGMLQRIANRMAMAWARATF